MKTNRVLPVLIAFYVVCSFALMACQKDVAGTATANGASALKIYLTDHQTPIFDSVFIDIQKLEVKLEDDTLPNGGWVSLSIHPGVYNILRFRNGLDTLFGNSILPNNKIKKLRLTLGTQNSATHDRQSFPLKVNDKNRQVVVELTDANFDVNGSQVSLWLDFDAGNSIKIDNSGQGNNNGYELDAHLNAFGQHNTGRIEGKIFPVAAHPIVKAFIGTDTATALPNNLDGEFKIVGLHAGNYTVIIDGQLPYGDTTINNVRVAGKEDTKLATITLHQ